MQFPENWGFKSPLKRSALSDDIFKLVLFNFGLVAHLYQIFGSIPGFAYQQEKKVDVNKICFNIKIKIAFQKLEYQFYIFLEVDIKSEKCF